MNIQNLEMKFQIVESAVAEGAEERFFQICSFDLAEAGQRRMEEAAYRVRDHLRAKMEICAAVRFWESPVLTGETLRLGEMPVWCDGFSQIPAEAIKGAFAYLLTIGETEMEEERSVMTELYHDIWGTAYVESSLQALRKDCLHPLLDDGLHLSECFGPGYYGMAMEEGAKLYGVLDGKSVGVTLRTSGLLMPEKSCLGLALVYDRGDIKMPRSCETCLGTKGGCRFCGKLDTKELE